MSELLESDKDINIELRTSLKVNSLEPVEWFTSKAFDKLSSQRQHLFSSAFTTNSTILVDNHNLDTLKLITDFILSVCIYQTNKESEWTSCNSKTQIKTKALNFVKSKNGESKCPPQKIMSQVCHDNGKSKNGKNLLNLNFTAKCTTYL